MLHNRLRAASAAGGGGGITDPNHPDLIAMYTMDNISGTTLVDETSNGYDTTLFNGPTSTAGIIGDSLNFNGVDGTSGQYANRSLYPGSLLQEFSICVWVNLDSVDDPLTRFLSHCARFASSGGINNSGAAFDVRNNGDGTNTVYAMYLVLNNETYTDSNGNTNTSYAIIAKSTPINIVGNWVFVEANYFGNSVELYINGSLNSSVSSTQSIVYSAEGQAGGEALGAFVDDTGVYFNADGKLDQFRFFNRPLTPSEISDLYNGGSGA